MNLTFFTVADSLRFHFAILRCASQHPEAAHSDDIVPTAASNVSAMDRSLLSNCELTGPVKELLREHIRQLADRMSESVSC